MLLWIAFTAGLAVGIVIGWLVGWWMRPTPTPRGVSLFWSVQGGSFMAELQAGESKTFGVRIVDAQGNAARVQHPKWSADPPDVLTITASDPVVEPDPPPPDPDAGMRPGKGGAGTRHRPGEGGAGTYNPPVSGRGSGLRDVNTPYYATIQAAGDTGGGSLTFTADADLGDGVKELVGNVSIIVLAGQAVGIEIEEIDAPPQGKNG